MSGNRTANTPTRVTIIVEEGDEARAIVVPAAVKADFEIREYDLFHPLLWSCTRFAVPYAPTTIEAEIEVGEQYEIHTGRERVAELLRPRFEHREDA